MHSISRVVARRACRPGALVSRAAASSKPLEPVPESETPPSSSVVASTRMESIATTRSSEIPIERRSLSRGLALNKFEKDFLIFPEYTDTDDVRNIEGFVQTFKDALTHAVDERAQEKDGELSAEVLAALQSSEISSCFVPKELGGLGMTYKDLIRINEALSADWSLSAHCTVSHMATTLLLLHGSTEQKEKYLPLIASGKARPAIAFPVASGSLSSRCEVHGSSGHGTIGFLMADGVRAFGSKKANLLIAFAQVTDMNKDKSHVAYIVDRTALKEGEKWETTREETLGLRAFDVGRVSLNVKVDDANVLGNDGREVAAEALSCSRLPLASAAVGYGKRVIEDVARVANETASSISPGVCLSAHPHIQRLAAQLALDLYALESVAYYIAGMLDERLPIVIDVENALLHRMSRAFLRKCTATLLEVLGTRAVDSRELYEKHIRDLSTLMALFDEGDTVEQIAMSTMSSWSATNLGKGKGMSTLSRLFGAEKTLADLEDPRLTHFIAEHAHPSLQLPCQELEHSMIRLDAVLRKIIGEDGKQVQMDYQSLERIVQVLQNNLVMVCTISRATRSYSIGLRNADSEISWTMWLGAEMSRSSWCHLNELADFFGLIRLNSSLLNAGRAVLDWGGYQIENPTERNW